MTVPKEYSISAWAAQFTGEQDKEFRQAVQTILLAIASHNELQASMVLKGGILLAIRYRSQRYTKDIDFSTSKTMAELDENEIAKELNGSLAAVVEELDYGLDCRVQKCELFPKRKDATFPSIRITVGYAYKGSSKHKRLQTKTSPSVVSIDYSTNEFIPSIENFKLTVGEEIQTYSLTDLIAEKYRALLQQVIRNRNRRQDVYDLYFILHEFAGLSDDEKSLILSSLLAKAKPRGLIPNISSMDDEEVKRRAGHEYDTLMDETLDELIDFNLAFEYITKFYRSLPWRSSGAGMPQ